MEETRLFDRGQTMSHRGLIFAIRVLEQEEKPDGHIWDRGYRELSVSRRSKVGGCQYIESHSDLQSEV
jgi:hypothetical protein